MSREGKKRAALRALRDEIEEDAAKEAEAALTGRYCARCVFFRPAVEKIDFDGTPSLGNHAPLCAYSVDRKGHPVDRLGACEHFVRDGLIRAAYNDPRPKCERGDD